jgi:isopentenyl phosphate kinase
LIVKLGGSVITDKGRKLALRKRVINRLARELSSYKGPMVVVHGGGSFGHPVASKYKIAEGYKNRGQLMGLSFTHGAMELLNSYVVEAFQKMNVPAISIQPSACAVVSDGRIKSMQLRPIKKLLELGITPVLYGDAVPDLRRGISILSGDQIVVYLAKKLRAPRVVFGTDVDGVYAADPKMDGMARLLRRITPANINTIDFLGNARAGDVTGGMKKKVDELLELAEQGVEAEIVNATRPNVLKRAIQGESGLGTIISRR